VRQAVVWLGLPDPCLTRTRLAESADTTADALAQLIAAWKQYDTWGRGVVLSELLGELYSGQREFQGTAEVSATMRVAIENLVGCPPGKTPTPRQLGNRLRHFRRRVVDGAYLDTIAERSKHGVVWRLCQTEVRP